MLQYTIRRIVGGVITLIAISVVTFLLFFAIPADPARLTCGKNCTPALIKQNRIFLGYDKSVPVQYWQFAKGLFVGRDFPDSAILRERAPQTVVHCSAPCLGYSQAQGQTVNHYLAAGLPITLSIAVGAFLLWFVFGVGFGIVAALRKGKLADKVILGVALVGYSFPTFFLGLVIIQIFTYQYPIFPQAGYTSVLDNPLSWAKGLLGPWIALAFIYGALYIRLTRAKMLETLTEDFVRTATAKGLSRRKVVFKHALRAALTPIITIAGLDLAAVLGGAALTEQVFNLNGIGKEGIFAIQQVDLPVIVAVVVVAAAAVVIMNLVVDLLYAVVDPRVRYS